MKKLLLLVTFFCSLFATETLSRPGDSRSHTVLVSIGPYRWLVEQIAKDKLKVNVLVPSSANMHTFEPSPKQMIGASKADIWFRIGERFESKALNALQSYNNNLQVVDLRDSVDLICNQQGNGCAHCGGCDLHFWLDPLVMKDQAEIIAAKLTRLYPEYAENFRTSLKEVQQTLEQLYQESETILSGLKERTFFVSHPAYAYYSRRFNLSQFSIEFEGRDPTPKQLTKILEAARNHNVKTIFIQRQLSNKGARLVAEQIGAKLVMLDPNSEEYLIQMRKMASQIRAK